MSKLFDIKGYFDSSFEYQFNDRNMWEGKILVEDDGGFEGVVKDPRSMSYTDDRFVFGVYYPGKVIRLFKWTPTSYSSPFVFDGNKEDNGYDGKLEVIQLFGSYPFGVSRIITEEAEKVREVSDTEINGVKARIDRYKALLMDDIGREFYGNSIALRSSMCKIILRNYEGRGFTQEESDSIMEECGPVNDRVISTTADEAYQFVKKIQAENPNFFSASDADDDELPF